MVAVAQGYLGHGNRNESLESRRDTSGVSFVLQSVTVAILMQFSTLLAQTYRLRRRTQIRLTLHSTILGPLPAFVWGRHSILNGCNGTCGTGPEPLRK